METDPLERHEVGGLYVTATVSYVRRACGDEGVEAMLDAAGLSADDLPRDSDWLTLAQMLALAEAAAEVTGDPEIGRRVGEEIFDLNIAGGLDQMMRGAGGLIEAIELLASHGSRLAGGWSLEVTARGDNWAEITSSTELVTDKPSSAAPGWATTRGFPRCSGTGPPPSTPSA